MTVRLDPLLQYIHSLAPLPESVGDGELLNRFVRQRDQGAFAELVRRHGPMVLGVCRRVLDGTAEAEDAFQAVFLVLSRKAARLRRPEGLAAWLHGVARHLALKCRRALARRRQHESAAAAAALPKDPLEELTARELLTALDEEIQRLPEVYRLPLVLCGLEGLSLAEAAGRLGWTHGSVKGRLLRARQRLQERLDRRGLTPLAGLLVLTASVPSALASSTVDAAMRRAAGEAHAGLLTKAALPIKRRIGLGLLLALVIAAVAGALTLQASPEEQSPPSSLLRGGLIYGEQGAQDNGIIMGVMDENVSRTALSNTAGNPGAPKFCPRGRLIVVVLRKTKETQMRLPPQAVVLDAVAEFSPSPQR